MKSKKRLQILFLSFLALVILLQIFPYLNPRSYIYYPEPVSAERIKYMEKNYKNVKEVTIETKDNQKIAGWFLK
jgi:hypothetical protein